MHLVPNFGSNYNVTPQNAATYVGILGYIFLYVLIPDWNFVFKYMTKVLHVYNVYSWKKVNVSFSDTCFRPICDLHKKLCSAYSDLNLFFFTGACRGFPNAPRTSLGTVSFC